MRRWRRPQVCLAYTLLVERGDSNHFVVQCLMPFRARVPDGKRLARNADAAAVKRSALELGADLAGVASAATLNAFPPDPRWPQTPERILPSIKSVIVLVQRIPAGAFRAVSNVPVQYMDMLVLRKMDKIAYRLADELERAGHPTFVTAAQETDWNLKRASYGSLSTRHLGVEAGLGTLGLEVNILTPEVGPRLYLTGILSELEPARTGCSCSGHRSQSNESFPIGAAIRRTVVPAAVLYHAAIWPIPCWS